MEQRKRILFADDDNMSRVIMQKFVERTNLYDCKITENGNDCLDYIKEHKVDLMILDYLLGDITALDICRKIASVSVNPDVQVIIASMVDSHEILKDNTCHNLVKVVQKPYFINDISRDLEEVFTS